MPARPLLLLVDGHSSHYHPESIHFAKDHDIIIFCLPPHTTHEAQPLDVSFFSPMKDNWSDVCHDFIQSSPGKMINKFNFSELFAKAWLKTCLPVIICNGFRRAGIIPFDPDVLIKRCPGADGSIELRRKVPSASKNASRVDQETTQGAPSDGQQSPPSDGQQSPPLDGQQPTQGVPMDGQQPAVNVTMEKSSFSNVTFSIEKENLFHCRFEEGYDLHDEEYELWLQRNHPESLPRSHASVMDFFPDVPPLGKLPYTPSINNYC